MKLTWLVFALSVAVAGCTARISQFNVVGVYDSALLPEPPGAETAIPAGPAPVYTDVFSLELRPDGKYAALLVRYRNGERARFGATGVFPLQENSRGTWTLDHAHLRLTSADSYQGFRDAQVVRNGSGGAMILWDKVEYTRRAAPRD